MSFGMGKSDSESRQSQGLNPGERVWFSDRSPGIFNQFRQRADEARDDPGGLQFLNTVDQLMPIGRYGMSQAADQGVSQLGRDLFTGASGNRAQRGFNTPYNLEAVLGDSMRMASGQLVPQANAFAMQRAQMAPQLRQASFGFGSQPMQALQQLLTGSSQDGSESQAFQGQADVSKLLPALLASDRRLKSNIVKIGQHPLGIGWYEYTIDGRRETGVMADEVLTVKPEAVLYRDDGYMMVDYGLIGRVE